MRLQFEQSQSSGQLVIDADDISKSYGPQPVVRDFSDRIMRGDRVGLIGPNGSGKTTLLRLLIGEEPPDKGEVRHGANVEIAYYDQQREQLDPERTIFDTVGDGNDTVTVNGRSRHVNAYLRDFLFPAERAQSPVKMLSGGERNRLLLARLFAGPRTCWCSTSRPTISIGTRTSRHSDQSGRARCCSWYDRAFWTTS